MLEDLERGTREDTEASRTIKIHTCSLDIADHPRRIYLFRSRVSGQYKYYVVFDPGYELGNIYIYEQKEMIPIQQLERKYPLIRDRYKLLLTFIKDVFGVENPSSYVLAFSYHEVELTEEEYRYLMYLLRRKGVML